MGAPDHATGVLVGLACGDALGRPVEFKAVETINERHGTVTEMVGQGSHGQPAGTVTDDTDMALCIARSLRDREAFDSSDITDRFVDWYLGGPFDIGIMTAEALREIRNDVSWAEAGRAVYERRPEGQNAGNGSAMRCAPIALAYHDDPDSLVGASRQSSAITHYDLRCQYGCAILNLTIANLLHERDSPLAVAIDRVREDAPAELVEALTPIPGGIEESELATSGYVVTTLQTALYHALTAESAEAAIVNTVNMGGDADTTGAIAGAVAGARHGATSIPDRWVTALRPLDETDLATVGRSLVERDIAPVADQGGEEDT